MKTIWDEVVKPIEQQQPIDLRKMQELLELHEDDPSVRHWIVSPSGYERLCLLEIQERYGGLRCNAFAWRKP